MKTLTGLTDKEVERSRREHGSNMITKKKKDGFFKRYLSSFGDPIIKILLIALFVNIIFMFRDFNWYESAGIAFAVLLATLVSTLSEYGSESAFEKLQEEAARISCRVIRNGFVLELPINDVVVGDIVLMQAGERVPADGELIEGELSADQSALNGEAKEARKRPGKAENDKDASRLFRGSVVCEGEGAMTVTSVGDNTVYGRLAVEIQDDSVESPLKLKLTRLAKTISVFGYAAAVVVAAANLFNNIVIDNHFNPVIISAYLHNGKFIMRDLMKAVTLGITVIVMAVPEGLPMMITVVLSANMRRMLKDNVLVRKLVGIETSGSLNILFTDKTGTLTKGKLEAAVFADGFGDVSDIRKLKKKAALYEFVKLNCYYNNGARFGTADGKKAIIGGNSTDRALLEFAGEGKAMRYERGETAPFNSRDKFSLAEIKNYNGGPLFLIKGAPEKILPGCFKTYDANGVSTDFYETEALRTALSELAGEPMRIIALCACANRNDALALCNLTLTGFIGIRDEVRDEARSAVADVMRAGVQVVMVTGDNKETAVSVAKKAGLISKSDNKNTMTSGELNNMSDGELKSALRGLRVIARALPSDKSRLVRISQELGLVAGMTGDGVNDSPALKRADVGFAMGSGTEIAKEAGDIVILDNNFTSIAKAILYGRTIFKSIRKFLIFQLSINMCAVGVSVIGPFIGIESPVTVIQMLWINMIMDTLAGLAYAGEAPLPEYMREPPKARDDKIINRYMYSQIISSGVYSTALCLVFLKLPFIGGLFRGEGKYMMTAFFAMFIFAGIFNSLNARTHRLNLLSHIYKNKAFILVMAFVFVIQLLLVYFGGAVFRTSGLTFGELLAALALASTVIFFDLGRKLFLRANHRKGTI